MSEKKTLLLAGLPLAFHVAVLLFIGTEQPGPILSNLTQVSMGIICAALAYQASRGSDVFARRFWLLVCARYCIYSLAQALGTYGDAQGHDFGGSVADVLFHLEDVPLGVALFLDPGREAGRISRADAVQLAHTFVFWAAVYLYSEFMPAAPQSGIGLVAGTDAVVAGSFFLRAMTTKSAVASALFGRVAIVKLLSTVNDAYSGSYGYDMPTGSWFDLIWSAEAAMWILTVSSWSWEGMGPLGARSDHTVQFLPLVFACFIVVLSAGVAQRQAAPAGIVIAASLVCTGAHLWVTRSAGSRTRPRAALASGIKPP